MYIPQANDLEFKKVEGFPAEQDCNCCGKPLAQGEQTFIASISLSDNSDYSVMVCSEQCVLDFKRHPIADHYITQAIKRCMQIS